MPKYGSDWGYIGFLPDVNMIRKPFDKCSQILLANKDDSEKTCCGQVMPYSDIKLSQHWFR